MPTHTPTQPDPMRTSSGASSTTTGPARDSAPAIGSRCWRARGRQDSGATVIGIDQDGGEILLELAYDEGGSGWWPLAAVVFAGG